MHFCVKCSLLYCLFAIAMLLYLPMLLYCILDCILVVRFYYSKYEKNISYRKRNTDIYNENYYKAYTSRVLK